MPIRKKRLTSFLIKKIDCLNVKNFILKKLIYENDKLIILEDCNFNLKHAICLLDIDVCSIP